MKIGSAIGFCSIAYLAFASCAVARAPLIEVPVLKRQVLAGTMPAIGERLPAEPKIVDLKKLGKTPGRYGGDLRVLMGKQKDTRMITVYGYARLLCFTPDFELDPDILKSVDVDAGRVFTLRLRKGHKWSDGHPFTTEDFRYYWEDVVNNETLTPFGPPKELLVEGRPPRFEVLDTETLRYSWSAPNPRFLHWLAGARPAAIYRPAHYLKQFHHRYGDKAAIDKLVASERRRNWADLHIARDKYYRADNPDRPTLQPWMNTTRGISERYVFTRNPYYFRADEMGRQLPYIDRIIVTLGASDMVAARTGSGESDLQARYLRFDHYTFLKRAEKRNGMRVLLWRFVKPSHKALYPNMNAADPAWRKLMRDIRFRRALSLGINRREINQVIFYGLGKESGNTVLEESPLFKPAYKNAWVSFDLKRANALLDDIGLRQRDANGLRKLPDGRPMELVIDSAGESTEETDMLQLISDSWRKLGIKLLPRSSGRDIFRRRALSGKAVMTIWSGLGNGLANAKFSPHDFVPSNRTQYQWPKWGQYIQTGGRKGEPPALAAALRLVELAERWQRVVDPAQQQAIWHEILQINAQNVFTIGIVNATLIPVVVNRQLRNLPDKGIYHWNPGAFFGIYKPDTFWYAPPTGRSDRTVKKLQ